MWGPGGLAGEEAVDEANLVAEEESEAQAEQAGASDEAATEPVET